MFGDLKDTGASGSRLIDPAVDLFPSLYMYNEVSELVFEMLEGSGPFSGPSSVFQKDTAVAHS